MLALIDRTTVAAVAGGALVSLPTRARALIHARAHTVGIGTAAAIIGFACIDGLTVNLLRIVGEVSGKAGATRDTSRDVRTDGVGETVAVVRSAWIN